MKKILITGGTTFVSKYTATYFVKHGYEVYVLNRGTKQQVEGVTLIQADRHALKEELKPYHFDAVLDITGYTEIDVRDLLDGLGSFEQYLFISSSAVYPETEAQPFNEKTTLAKNKFWGWYGTDKIAAEKALLERVPNAYILRPPYLYGPMNNVYREAFVFDCARADRPFFLPKDGDMKLQFFHVEDLCRLMEAILNINPKEHILNAGNEEAITIKDWVRMCYACYDKTSAFVNVYEEIEQRQYFSFYNYEYHLDVSKMQDILPDTIPLVEGLRDCAKWYDAHEEEVNKKPYFDFIDQNFKSKQ